MAFDGQLLKFMEVQLHRKDKNISWCSLKNSQEIFQIINFHAFLMAKTKSVSYGRALYLPFQ